ncbi:MAG: cation:dicarboxylate symporter family transporter [Planctomycetota bacterium]|jgi:Na+/H+-dicarboxylate symporter/ABC-type amino acid transport substrate-binding protein
MDNRDAKKHRLGSSELTILGLVLGVATGIFFGEMAGYLRIVGDVFINLLLITVIPYISVSLITGLGGLEYSEITKLSLRGGGLVLLIWLLTIIILVLMPLSFPNWPSASFFHTSQIEQGVVPDFLRLFIPSNPFYAFANAIVPAIVVFCILIGVALISIPKRDVIIEPLSAIREALIKVTSMISKLAPIGVFSLMASNVGTIAIVDLARLQVYIVLHALIVLVLSLWILPGLVTVFTPLGHLNIVRSLRTPLITAFATGSTLIVLPLLAELCKQLIKETKTFDESSQEHAEASVDVLIPTLFPFPSAATLMALFFILFSGWYVGDQVSPASYPTLFGVGIPSLFGGTMLTIPFLLDLVRLPSELFQVFVSVDVVASRFGTLLAAMHYACLGLIGTFLMIGKLRIRWYILVRFVLVSIVLIGGVLYGVHGLYSRFIVPPYTQDQVLKSMRFMNTPQPAKVFTEIPSELENYNEGPASLSQIEERGVLRVCYQPDKYPSAFFNRADSPELVGFDIEMAHGFARRLELPLEFIPARNEREAARLLNAGICDLYFRTLQISVYRTEIFGLTSPVYQSSLGLIVRDYRRREFETWKQIQTNQSSLTFALEDSSRSLMRAKSLFPDAKLLAMEDQNQQRQLLASDGADVDAIMDMAEQGAAWTLLYPSFNLVVPKPTVYMPVAYAAAPENPGLLLAFDAWLTVVKAEGKVDRLYRHWMLGEAAKIERPRRWSVIRDVLGWVE